MKCDGFVSLNGLRNIKKEFNLLLAVKMVKVTDCSEIQTRYTTYWMHMQVFQMDISRHVAKNSGKVGWMDRETTDIATA